MRCSTSSHRFHAWRQTPEASLHPFDAQMHLPSWHVDPAEHPPAQDFPVSERQMGFCPSFGGYSGAFRNIAPAAPTARQSSMAVRSAMINSDTARGWGRGHAELSQNLAE